MKKRSGIHVLIASENRILQECLVDRLSREQGFSVLPVVAGASELLLQLKRRKPDLVLLDVDALGPVPERLLTRLRRDRPGVRILVLATRTDDHSVARALRYGAAGVIGKTQTVERLISAMQAVAGGEIWAGRIAMAQAISGLAATNTDHSAQVLTPREYQLVSLLKEGYRNKELADLLKIRERTVKAHLHSLFRKMNVRTRVEAVLKFAEDV